MDLVELANSVQITGEELLRVSEASEGSVSEGGAEEAMFLVAKYYRGDWKRANAVFFRMRALSKLIGSKGAIKGWTFPIDAEGNVIADETVFAVSATHPLIEVDGEPGFEPQSFMDALLDSAELEVEG